METYDLAVKGHDHTDIIGAYSAKMSTPYSTAVALIYGRAGLQEFTKEILEDKNVQNLTSKVQVIADADLSHIFPSKQSAVVTITTKKGVCSERVDFPKGEPENPLAEEEFRERYEALMAYGGIKENVYTSIFNKVNQPDIKAADLIRDL